MNTTIVKGCLLEMRGRAKATLGSSFHNREMYLNGKRDEFLGKGIKNVGKVRRFFSS